MLCIRVLQKNVVFKGSILKYKTKITSNTKLSRYNYQWSIRKYKTKITPNTKLSIQDIVISKHFFFFYTAYEADWIIRIRGTTSNPTGRSYGCLHIHSFQFPRQYTLTFIGMTKNTFWDCHLKQKHEIITERNIAHYLLQVSWQHLTVTTEPVNHKTTSTKNNKRTKEI